VHHSTAGNLNHRSSCLNCWTVANPVR